MRKDGRLLVVALALVAGTATAVPVPTLDLRSLVESSDLVVVGTINSVVEREQTTVVIGAGQMHGRIMTGLISDGQALKGSAESSTLEIQFVLPDDYIGYRSISEGTKQLFFLKKKAGQFEPTNPYYPTLVAVSGPSQRGDSAFEAVVRRIAAVLQSPSETAERKEQAVVALWGVQSENAAAGLRFALRDQAQNVKLFAAAALLRVNDLSALPVAEAALSATGEALPTNAAQNLQAGIAEGLTAEGAIPALNRLCEAPDASTRRAAVSALRRTKSPLAIAALGKALQDRDEDVRFLAVVGLADVTGDASHRPNRQSFRANETQYVTFWKDWVGHR
jgi:hypothetical protein